jgi:hypothetical protein
VWRLRSATLATAIGDAILVGGMTFEAAGFHAAGLSITTVLMSQAAGATMAAGLAKRLLAVPTSNTVLSWAAAAALLNVVVLLFPLHNLVTLAALSLGDSLFSVFLYSASSALVSRLAPDPNKSQFMASFQNLRTAGALMGVPLGALLVTRSGLSIIFVLNACSYAVYAVVWYASRSVFVTADSAPSGDQASAGSPLPTSGIPWIPIVTICGCIVLTVSVDTAGLVLARDRLGSLDQYTGLILLLWPLGGIVANRIPPPQTLRGDVLVLYGASAAMGLSLALMPGLPFVGWLALCYVLGGACMGLQNRSITAVILKLATPASLAASFAKFSAMANAASFAGYALSGALIVVSASATLEICGFLILAISVGGYFLGRVAQSGTGSFQAASGGHSARPTTSAADSRGTSDR